MDIILLEDVEGLFAERPDKSLGEELPLSLPLNQGAARIEKELADQPAVRARMLATFGRVYSWLEESAKAVDFYRRAIEDPTPTGKEWLRER